MAVYITDLRLTLRDDDEKPSYSLLNKVGEAYLWYQHGPLEQALTDVKILYGDEEVPEGYTRLEVNTQHGLADARAVHVALQRGGDQATTVRAVGITSSSESYMTGDFEKIQPSLNPDDNILLPRSYIMIQTEAHYYKVTTNDYEVGERLDALDGNMWRTAVVVDTFTAEAGNKSIKIHFEGWNASYDEWRHVQASDRLAPLCIQTKGKWTGKGDSPPFSLSQNLQKVSETMQQLDSLLEGSQGQFDEAQQEFFLGANLKLFLRTLGGICDDPSLITVVNQYIQLNIRAVLIAMQYDISSLNQKFFMLLRASFNSKAYFYRSYGVEADAKCEASRYAQRTGTISVHLINNVEYFGKLGGFDFIGNQLKAFADPQDTKHTSFLVVSSLTRAFANFRSLLNPEFAVDFVNNVNLQEVILKGLQGITDQELKSFKESNLNNLITDVKNLLMLSRTEDQIAEFMETINLDTALRLMTSEVLEKKINGMTKFDDIVKSITMTDESEAQAQVAEQAGAASGYNRRQGGVAGFLSTMYPGQFGAQQAPAEAKIVKAKFLTPPILVQWLNERNVVATLLDRSQHEQIIRRSPVVLRFLAQQGALQDSHIDLLWNVAAG